MLRELQSLVEAADFDAAFAKLNARPIEEVKRAIRNETPEINHIRLACITADVYDYAGRFFEAAACINLVAVEAKRQVTGFLDNCKVEKYESPIDDSKLVKQCCWALIHLATAHYRNDENEKLSHESALTLLEGPAKRALEQLEAQRMMRQDNPETLDCEAYQDFQVHGTFSRLWYGIGLVRRQQRAEREAREAFTRSIIYASRGLESSQGKRSAFYDYSIGKAMGLGLGWISYSEARLSESLAELVAARRLLAAAKGVLFIQRYIDIIYCRALLSAGSDHPDRINDAIDTLKLAIKNLAGHDLYRPRAEYAMALSLVNRFLIREKNGGGALEDLHHAFETIEKAESAGWLAKNDRGTLCNFLILKSRIHRIQRDYEAALDAARAARRIGEAIDFVKVDSLICLGEAFYYKNDHTSAIENFRMACDAAKGSRKLKAAAQLHLARTLLESGNRVEARKHFQAWKNSSAGIENAFIRSLSKELERKLNDFIITADVESLWAETHLNELRHWLAVEAQRRWGTDPELLEEHLGVTARTIQRWADRNFPNENR